MKGKTLKTMLIALTVIALPMGAIWAQAPEVLWIKFYGGSGPQETGCSKCVQQTTDGGFIVGAIDGPIADGINDMYLIKTDPQGNIEWERTYDFNEDDCCFGVRQTSDGGYIMGGATGLLYEGETKICLVKTDANGDVEWMKTPACEGEPAVWCFSLEQTMDGGYILGGANWRVGPYGYSSRNDMYIVKTDAQGDSVWKLVFGNSSGAVCWDIGQAQDGGYVAAGGINGEDTPCLLKIDNQGYLQWQHIGAYSECYTSLDPTYDGGLILGGYALNGESDMLLVKTDPSGNEEWRRTFGIGDYNYSGGVQQTSDGGHIAAGATQGEGPDYLDRIYVVRTDALGNLQWQKVISLDSYSLVCNAIQQTSDGGYILAGTAISWPEQEWDICLVRIAPEIQNIGTISGTVTPAFADLTVNLLNSSNTIVATTSTAENGSFSFAEVVPTDYFVDLIPPAGYAIDENHLAVVVLSGQVAEVSFNMTLMSGVIQGHVNPAYAGITITITDNDEFYASTPTDNAGFYHFENLTGNTNYVVELVLPLDFLMVSENPVTRYVVGGTTEIIDFAITPVPAVNEARSKGYWKHQVKANVTGNGSADYDSIQLTMGAAPNPGFALEIFQHFYGNQTSPVQIPGVTHKFDGSAGPMTLADMNTTFSNNLSGSPIYKQACQQFLALLLNVVSSKLSQTIPASQDGATVAQAIYHIDQILTTNTETAKNIAETLNEGQTVAAEVIPSGLPNIIYGEVTQTALQVAEFRLAEPFPNPFNSRAVISFQLPVASFVELRLYDVSGKLATSLVDGWQDAGVHEVLFEGWNLASGIYLYRFSAGEYQASGKMVLLK